MGQELLFQIVPNCKSFRKNLKFKWEKSDSLKIPLIALYNSQYKEGLDSSVYSEF